MKTAMMIGAGIRFHRRRAGLTQIGLARLAGVGKTAVFDVEKGKESIQMDTLIKILSILNMELDVKSPLMGEFMKTTEAQTPDNTEPS